MGKGNDKGDDKGGKGNDKGGKGSTTGKDYPPSYLGSPWAKGGKK